MKRCINEAADLIIQTHIYSSIFIYVNIYLFIFTIIKIDGQPMMLGSSILIKSNSDRGTALSWLNRVKSLFYLQWHKNFHSNQLDAKPIYCISVKLKLEIRLKYSLGYNSSSKQLQIDKDFSNSQNATLTKICQFHGFVTCLIIYQIIIQYVHNILQLWIRIL